MVMQQTAKNTFLLNTGATPTAVDVISTSKKVVVNPKATTLSSNLYGNGKGGSAKTHTIKELTTAEPSIEVDGKYAGTAGATPKIAALLKVCGLQETITAGTDVVYTPELTGVTGIAKAYVDGEVRTISGVAATFSMMAKLGDFLKFSFKLKGFTTLAPVTEANPAVTLDTNEYITVSSITAITEGENTIDMQEIDFDYGGVIQDSKGTENLEYYVDDFKPTLKIKATKTKGNAAHWDDLASNTVKEVIVTCGTVSGKIFEFKASFCNPSMVDEADSNGRMTYTKTYLCENSAGGDNFSITYK